MNRINFLIPFKVLAFFLLVLSACQRGRSLTDTSPTLGVETAGVQTHSGLILESQSEYLSLQQSKMTRSFSPLGSNYYQELPPKIDLSTGFPLPGNQGKQNSCTGWTVSYAVKSFQENREHGWGLDYTHLFSPSFIYNQINEGVDEGASLLSALQFMKTKGTIPLYLMPYHEQNFRSQPAPTIQRWAQGFRSLGHLGLL